MRRKVLQVTILPLSIRQAALLDRMSDDGRAISDLQSLRREELHGNVCRRDWESDG